MRSMLLLGAAMAALLADSPHGLAASPLPDLCQSVSYEQMSFVACTVDPAVQHIRMFLRAADGQPYGSLDDFAEDGPNVLFAMNAGMFLPDGLPQGL